MPISPLPPDDAVPVLVLDGVSKRFGRRVVLRDIHLALPSGTFVPVRGRNGTGKSTLLRVIAGVSSPSSGRVRGLARHVGYVPERGELGRGLSVHSYLQYLARLGRREGRLRRAARVEELVDAYGLGRHADADLRTLSKGTVKKVAIVQALLAPSDLLVLDEPTDGLDSAAVARLRIDIEKAVAQGCCVVVACHTTDLDAMAVPTLPVVIDEHGVSTPAAQPRPRPRVRVVTAALDAAPREVLVAPEEVDAVLLGVLSAGGSVHEVQPLPEGGIGR